MQSKLAAVAEGVRARAALVAVVVGGAFVAAVAGSGVIIG
jgi:hypothetical protein